MNTSNGGVTPLTHSYIQVIFTEAILLVALVLLFLSDMVQFTPYSHQTIWYYNYAALSSF